MSSRASRNAAILVLAATCCQARFLIETEKHLDAVVRVLFKHYGEQLYDVNVRQKLLSLEREHSDTIKKDRLRYHYYRYVAYSYNQQFSYAWEELGELRTLPFAANPNIQQVWLNLNSSCPAPW